MSGYLPNRFTVAPFESRHIYEHRWGVWSASGINVLGANLENPGAWWAYRADAEDIASAWNAAAGIVA